MIFYTLKYTISLVSSFLKGSRPDNFDLKKLKSDVQKLDFIIEISNLYVWTQGKHSIYGSCKLLVTQNHEVAKVRSIFKSFGINNPIIEVQLWVGRGISKESQI